MVYFIAFFSLFLIVIFLISRKKSRKTIPQTSDFINNSNEYLLRKAFELQVSRNFDDAINILDNLIEERGFVTKETLDLRALVCDQLGFFLDSIDDYSESLKIDNSDANNFFMRGVAKFKIGDYSGSKIDLEKAVSIMPKMEIYNQQLNLVQAIDNPEMEEFAKEKASREGLLKRRIKTAKSLKTHTVNNSLFESGIQSDLILLKKLVKDDPNNLDLKKMLKEAEQRFKDEN
ncbi:MAG: hypothetical protein B7Y37_08895 [Sphingobacteriia bacterium 28-36-52]|nr:MAG: hypothetical protein B7Y37_08895 [Sphingobacteriia bacterium 28-36-52]